MDDLMLRMNHQKVVLGQLNKDPSSFIQSVLLTRATAELFVIKKKKIKTLMLFNVVNILLHIVMKQAFFL